MSENWGNDFFDELERRKDAKHPSTATCCIAAAPRHCVTTKTIEYECGCAVVLSAWGEKDAGYACQKHGMGIKRITIVEEYISLGDVIR